MDKMKIYAGEDFSIKFMALDNAGVIPEDLSPYEIVVQLSHSTICRRITASTFDGDDIKITLSNDKCYFTIDVSHLFTAQMCGGDMMVSIMLIHKQNGIRVIAEDKMIRIEESKIKRMTV